MNARASRAFVAALSWAISTAIALVASPTVDRIRRRCVPYPSCTRLSSSSRFHGMFRRAAASTIACVLGPSRVWSTRRCAAVRTAGSVEGFATNGGIDEGHRGVKQMARRLVHARGDGHVEAMRAGQSHGLPVVAGRADGLAPLDGHVLHDVAQIGAFAQPPDEAAGIRPCRRRARPGREDVRSAAPRSPAGHSSRAHGGPGGRASSARSADA